MRPSPWSGPLAMRRTLFVVPVEMAPLLQHSSTVALGSARNENGWPDGWRAMASPMMARPGSTVVRKNGERTAESGARRWPTELTKDVPELGEKITFYKKDGSVLNTVGMSTRILFLLATEGKVIRGRPKGTWVSSMYRWAPMDDWLGGPMPEMSKPEAQVGCWEVAEQHSAPGPRST